MASMEVQSRAEIDKIFCHASYVVVCNMKHMFKSSSRLSKTSNQVRSSKDMTYLRVLVILNEFSKIIQNGNFLKTIIIIMNI